MNGWQVYLSYQTLYLRIWGVQTPLPFKTQYCLGITPTGDLFNYKKHFLFKKKKKKERKLGEINN